MTKIQQLEWAIERWAVAALQGAANHEYAAICDQTVKALQLELETGEAHCNCHLKPSKDCPCRIESRVLNHDRMEQ